MTSVKNTAKRQHARLLDKAAQQLAGLTLPREGWISTMRKALGMSAPALARRLGVTKPAIYQAERKEREGGITIQQMEKLAAALGGRFVYAIIPEEGCIENVLKAQAYKKAHAVAKHAGAHMALENQALGEDQMEDEIEALVREFLHNPPGDFWEEK